MSDDPKLDKLDAVSSEIEKASEKHQESKPAQPDAVGNSLANAGYNFVGSVIGGAFIGWGIDKFVHTQPWGMIGFITLGFAVGMYHVWQALK